MIIITGSYPPDVCGVGDFASKLILKSKSDFLIAKTINDFLILGYTIRKRKDILLEYPTQGYGWSLSPHIFTFFRWIYLKPIVVHLHEFKYQSFKNRLASCIFLMFSSKIIVTNEEEYKYISRFFKNKITIIPIFSNVPILEKNIIRDFDLIYFGQIRPNKGIEKFINEAEKLKDRNIKIIGAIPESFINYAEKLMKSTNIEFITNCSLDEVSVLLTRSRCAYLPFLDGASSRRGSLLACLEHGVKVLSSRGQGSACLENYIHFIEDIELSDFVILDIEKDVYYPIDENLILKKIENVVH